MFVFFPSKRGRVRGGKSERVEGRRGAGAWSPDLGGARGLRM